MDSHHSLPNLIPRLGIGEWHSQFEQLGKGAAKVLEKQVLVLAVSLHPLFEFRVGKKENVTWKHHECPRRILVLIGSSPRLAIVRHFL
jgi:hypothetical protein